MPIPTVGQARRRGRSHSAAAGRVRVSFAIAVSAALLGLLQAPAGAASSPYSGHGYDASYPAGQCTATSYPPGFAIIGLGGGRPFTMNSCLAHEWAFASASGAPAAPSLYFNTGYAGAYAKDIAAACKNAVANAPIPPGTSAHQSSVEQQAWEIGCSEVAYAAAREPGTPAMWWADVETGNSWSTNTAYNDFAVDGIAYEMSGLQTSSGAGGGFYSTPAMWNQIVGTGFVSTPAITADWQPAPACPASGFSLQTPSSYAPVWVIQNGTAAVNGVSFSADQAC